MGNNVREVVVSDGFDKKMLKMLEDMPQVTLSYQKNSEIKPAYMHLLSDIEDTRIHQAFGILTNYLDDTQKRSMAHLNHVELSMSMTICKWTLRPSKT